MPAFVVYNLESLYLKELSDKASICSLLLEAVSCHATVAWNLLLYLVCQHTTKHTCW